MTRSARLVFAHYFGGSGRSWDGVIQALGADADCVAPTLAGFGGTVSPANGSSLEAYSDQIENVAGDSAWIAVGHSMGGKIALATAARAPAGLKGVILIASSPPTPEPMSLADRQKTIAAFRDRAAAHDLVTKITDAPLPPTLFEACVDDEVAVAKSTWLWWLERGTRLDISGITAGVQVPVLVIVGDRDPVLGEPIARRVVEGLGNARLEIVGMCGHLAPQERPQAVANLIRTFQDNLLGAA